MAQKFALALKFALSLHHSLMWANFSDSYDHEHDVDLEERGSVNVKKRRRIYQFLTDLSEDGR